MTIIFELEGGFVHEWASGVDEITESMYKEIRGLIQNNRTGAIELVYAHKFVTISISKIVTISLENNQCQKL